MGDVLKKGDVLFSLFEDTPESDPTTWGVLRSEHAANPIPGKMLLESDQKSSTKSSITGYGAAVGIAELHAKCLASYLVLVMDSVLSLCLYHLRAIFREERDGSRHHFRLSGFVGFGGRRCPGSYRNPDREKEFFLPGW